MATALIQPPSHFEPGDNPARAWDEWRSAYELYEEACEYTEKQPGPRRALLLHVIGPAARKTYQGFEFAPFTEERPRETAQEILDKFGELYRPYRNVTHSSALFNAVVQKPDQTIDQLVAELKLLAVDCDYGDKCDRLIGDRLIFGIRDAALRERLLRESSLTLDKIINICKSAEIAKTQAKILQPTTTEHAVDALRKDFKRKKRTNNEYRPNKPQRAQQHHTNKVDSSKTQQRACSRCGTAHRPMNCPAYGLNCHKCGTFGHFSRVCKKKNVSAFTRNSQVAALDSSEVSDLENVTFIGELTSTNVKTNLKVNSKWNHTLVVNDNKIVFKIDTGAESNLLPVSVLNCWEKKPTMRAPSNGIITYSGEKLPIIGECDLNCDTPNGVVSCTFSIVNADYKAILGGETSEILGLVTRIGPKQSRISTLQKGVIEYDLQKRIDKTSDTSKAQKAMDIVPTKLNVKEIMDLFPDVFVGVGKLPGIFHITLKPNSTPHVSAARSIPQALQNKVRLELLSMETDNIICKVTEPTDWVHPLAIIIKKNGELRLCLDPRQLNAVIKREYYKIPTQEELFSKLGGCTVFSLFDAKNAFWHLQLDDDSSKLCTFATPWGRYHFLRMPFGLNCAPEQFQRAMDSVFGHCGGEFNPYFDDVLIAAKTENEHSRLVYKLLTLARANNLKFNKHKVKLGLPKISYLGHVLSVEGISPDPEKVHAVLTMEAPSDTTELKRFLGMVTYLTKFIPCFSNRTNQLRSLLKSNTPWNWDENHTKEFELLKKLITTAPVLKYFETDKPITVSTDASSYGVGCVLLQSERPVAYASASLTQPQQAWAQIEKELLAVVYTCERFNYFIFGTFVTVQTDHKPLLGLLTKPLEKITPRLQRLILRLQRYNVTLAYVPGKFLNVADTLSRAPSRQHRIEMDEGERDIAVCTLLLATTPKLDSIREQTATDNMLKQVAEYIKKGWPVQKNIKDPELKAYSKYKDELHIVDGIVCRGQRIVLPKESQKDALDKLHIAHRGIIATKNKAGMALYWPSMNTQLEQMIKTCSTCQQYQRSNQREPLEDRTIPTRPWQRLALDFFHLNGVDYILLMDYFSKFVEAQPMISMTARSVILALKAVFARFGLPDELVSDNGPPMNSDEVKTFFKNWDILHNPSAPYNPRSNGQAERGIQTLKKSLIKAAVDGKDLFTVLMDHRNTPSNGLKSPAELLMGRRIRTLVPVLPSTLKPQYNLVDTHKQLKALQAGQHKHGDEHTRPLTLLHSGQEVWFSLNKGWQPGIIMQVGPQKRSYTIEGFKGTKYRRNRFHIRPRITSSASPEQNEYSQTVNVPDDYYVDPQQPFMVEARQDQGMAGTPSVTTRSGRVVIRPKKYEDYVLK